MPRRMLLIVDPQVDFVDGSLPVPGGFEAMTALGEYLKEHPERYSLIVVTADMHPTDHCSFDVNGGSWPVHCVAGTPGAEMMPELSSAVAEYKAPNVLIGKGERADTEEYSVFTSRRNTEHLVQLVRKYGIEEIEVAGLAGDYCVLATLSDGINIFGHDFFRLLRQFSPSIDGGKRLEAFARENLRK